MPSPCQIFAKQPVSMDGHIFTGRARLIPSEWKSYIGKMGFRIFILNYLVQVKNGIMANEFYFEIAKPI